ncbi:hypothetical protein L1281_002075 [Neisseria sp. HSC-16F19]|nr:metallophosphoesterase [Neisseria sp. HSC-16F19]MCP2041475.1 hypothetical protein [Neisseria sp. HSC-16F19]
MNALPASHLFRPLPGGALDIVGDVHGEWGMLEQLLYRLGYDEYGRHPQGRKLVFVGDLCDRGQDSPQVLDWLIEAVRAEHAWAVLGNHEMNLLMDDPKDGSGWYFNERTQDEARYAPWRHYPEAGKAALCEALAQWPLVLQREDLRIVHAAWLPESLQRIADLGDMPLCEQYRWFEDDFRQQYDRSVWAARYEEEQSRLAAQLEDENFAMGFLEATAHYDLWRSHANPIRALTCGVEVMAPAPFYANGRWRFTARCPWWQQYEDDAAVLIGHYWRLWDGPAPVAADRLPLFVEEGAAWQGAKKAVFCVDYSAGARWRDRQKGVAAAASGYHLAAMRWPEQVLVREDGVTAVTVK